MDPSGPRAGTDPLLTLGWFRTGSTFLYETLRQGWNGAIHFYEPFNPLMPRLFEDGDSDELFAGKQHLFEPYLNRESIVEEWFDPSFGQHNFFLDNSERLDGMDRYLVELASTADPAHFQMNRALGRLDYLRELFPSAKCVLLIRNPWATWCSWHEYPEDPYGDELSDSKYQQHSMLRELSHRLPEESLEYWGLNDHQTKHPLDTFLTLWGFIHYLALQQISDYRFFHVLRYEDLVANWSRSLDLLEEDLELELDRSSLPDPHRDSLDRWRSSFDDDDLKQSLDRIPDGTPIQSMLTQFEYVS